LPDWTLVAILIVAAVLRFQHIGTSPGWFVDEGTYFDVTRNLMEGRRQVGQMEVTFAAPHMTAPPLWFLAEAAWMSVWGQSMTAFRALVALCGVACVALVAGIGRRLGGWPVGLWAAAFLAVAPRAVLFSRMAIPYTPGMTAALVWLWAGMKAESGLSPSRRTAWLALSCLAAALAPLTLYYGVILVPAGLLWAGAAWMGRRRGRHREPVLSLLIPPLCAALSLGGFLLAGWVVWGESFRTDLQALRAVAAPAPLADQARHWATYLVQWGDYGGVVERLRGALPILGFSGLLLLRRRAASMAVAAAGFGFAHIVLRRSDAIVHFIDYPMMPVFPFLCLGLGALVSRRPVALLRRLRQFRGKSGGWRRAPMHPGANWIPAIGGTLLIVCLAGYTVLALASGWTHPNPPTLSFGMIPSLRDARAAAEWANDRLTTSGVVTTPTLIVASSNLWPLLHVPHSDINQLMAARGQGSGFYHYDCLGETSAALREEHIAVFIEGPFTELRRLGVHYNPYKMPDSDPWIILSKTLHRVHQTWPSALRAGDYTVRVPPGGAFSLSPSPVPADPDSH